MNTRRRHINAARRRRAPKRVYFHVIDEFHKFAAGLPALSTAAMAARQFPRQSQRRILLTQAIMESNSGKRLRLIGSARYEDGSAVYPPPRKFLPAQVRRRLLQQKAEGSR